MKRLGPLAITIDRLLGRRRWIVAFLLGIALAVLTVVTISPSWRSQANEWDVIFGVLDAPFITMVILSPMFFTISVDIAIRDITEWGPLLLVRTGTRNYWWATKLIGIGIAGISYGIVMLGATWMVSFAFVSIQGGWGPLAGVLGSPTWFAAQGHASAELSLLLLAALFISGLIAAGQVGATLAMLFRSSTLAWAILSMAALLSYGAWRIQPRLAPWLLGGQLLLITHAPYNPSAPAAFTAAWSFGADGLLWLLATLVGWRRACTMSI